MSSRIGQFFEGWEFFGGIVAALWAIGLLGYITFRWLAHYYGAGEWLWLTAILVGVSAVVSWTIWAWKARRRSTALGIAVIVLVFAIGPALMFVDMNRLLP